MVTQLATQMACAAMSILQFIRRPILTSRLSATPMLSSQAGHAVTSVRLLDPDERPYSCNVCGLWVGISLLGDPIDYCASCCIEPKKMMPKYKEAYPGKTDSQILRLIHKSLLDCLANG